MADARLFDGGHVGVDLRHADLFFERLILRGSQAVALVTTGNPTFATGPRQAARLAAITRTRLEAKRAVLAAGNRAGQQRLQPAALGAIVRRRG